MLLQHLKFAIRLFWKDRLYTTLNLIGLFTAIVSSILVYLYLKENLSYDKHYPNHKQIYRLTNRLIAPGVEFNSALTGTEIGVLVAEDLNNIESYVRIRQHYEATVTVKNGNTENTFSPEKVVEADSNLFEILPEKFIYGNKESFKEPQTVVISRPIAIQLFGRENVVGEMLYQGQKSYKVAGVIEKQPENTHLKYDVIFHALERFREDSGENGNVISEAHWNPDLFTFFKLKDSENVEKLEETLNTEIYNRYFKEFGDQIDGRAELSLERLDQIHFYSDKDFDAPQGTISYVYTLASIGILMLFLACINYMNLATARASGRIGEIAIRKVLGNFKRNLVIMLLTESMALTFIALLAAIFTVYFIITYTSFNSLIGYNLSFSIFSLETLLIIIIAWIGIGLFSGIYPSYYLSKFPMISSLKGSFTENGSKGLRRFLLVLQLSISLVVLISTYFMNTQINYLAETDLGFNKEQLLRIPLKDSLARANAKVYSDRIKQIPQVNNVSSSWAIPGVETGEGVMKVESKEGEMIQKQFKQYYVSDGFIETMGIEIIEGRAPIPGSANDNNRSFLLNEIAVKELGWKDPIGKKIGYFHAEEFGTVIGVFRNINYNSLHNPIESMFILQQEGFGGNLLVNYNVNEREILIESLNSIWKDMPFVYPFEYYFIDEAYMDQYDSDQLQLQLIAILSLICIMISILGLVGTSSYDSSRKLKEVSIRKALGATNRSILTFFVSKYITPMLISIAISIPLANYIVTEWLKNFQYHIELHFFGFLLPALFLGITVISVILGQSIKIAKTNPTKELR